MVINIVSVQYNGRFLPDINYTVDPRLLPLGNPVKLLFLAIDYDA